MCNQIIFSTGFLSPEPGDKVDGLEETITDFSRLEPRSDDEDTWVSPVFPLSVLCLRSPPTPLVPINLTLLSWLQGFWRGVSLWLDKWTWENGGWTLAAHVNKFYLYLILNISFHKPWKCSIKVISNSKSLLQFILKTVFHK